MWREVCFPEGQPQISVLDPVKVGAKLKRIRVDQEFSVSKIAGLLHISPTTLRSYESGRSLVRLDVIYALAQIYDTSVDDLLSETTNH